MKNLVFTSAGDHHNLAQWSSPDRNYEIFVCYYGQGRFENPFPVEVLVNDFKGSKFQNLKRAYDSASAYFNGFSSIFVLDDDIEITSAQIDELFEVREKYDLDIVQPSQSPTGKISYPSLITFEGCFGRLINFCEVCAPLFKTSVLISFLQEYDGTLAGWGIDWWYSHRVFESGPRRIAVIDAIPCRNPHASDKGIAVREIDKYQSRESRKKDWEMKRKYLGLSDAGGYPEFIRVVDELKRGGAGGEGSVPPRISIIIEWENVFLADQRKIPALFSTLRREIDALGEQVEMIVMFDPVLAGKEELNRLFRGEFPDDPDLVGLQFHEATGKHYYDFKNEGVLKALGEIVVFVDSDIEPEPGWLINMVGYLDDHQEVGVVGGYTYVIPTGIVSKAFSFGWFFPLRPEDGNILKSPADFLWSNNSAYRRNVLLAHPYRTSPYNETRGACSRQFKEMKANGVKTANISSAVVGHPAPNGLRHFVTRALAEGRDYAVGRLLEGGERNRLRHTRSLVRTAVAKVKRTSSNSIRESARGNSTLVESPILVAIMAAYYAIFMAGALRTLISPGSVKDKWRI